MLRAILVQKLLAFGIVIPAVILLDAKEITVAFIVFGQGHFIAAYYYQWRAGKLTDHWLTFYVAGAAVLFAYAYMTQAFEIIAFVTMVIFLLHHFQDEVLLFGKERSLIRTLEQLGPVIMYTAIIADALFGSYTALYAAYVVLALLVVYGACITVFKTYAPDVLSWYFTLITVALVYIALANLRIDASALAGLLILNHYVCWYVHFYFRFENNPERLKGYIRDMLVINALVVATFLLFLYVPLSQPLLVWFFAPMYFYIWTILHIVSSVRKNDYLELVRWR